MQGIHIGKEEVKLFLFADDLVLWMKDPKNSTKTLKSYKHIQQISKIQNENTHKAVPFPYTISSLKEIRKVISYTIVLTC
jgi:hypothetical protein